MGCFLVCRSQLSDGGSAVRLFAVRESSGLTVIFQKSTCVQFLCYGVLATMVPFLLKTRRVAG
jgi:hypothetical protein